MVYVSREVKPVSLIGNILKLMACSFMCSHISASLCFLARPLTSASQINGTDYNVYQIREWKSIAAIEKIIQKQVPADIFFTFETHAFKSFVIMAKNKYIDK